MSTAQVQELLTETGINFLPAVTTFDDIYNVVTLIEDGRKKFERPKIGDARYVEKDNVLYVLSELSGWIPLVSGQCVGQ